MERAHGAIKPIHGHQARRRTIASPSHGKSDEIRSKCVPGVNFLKMTRRGASFCFATWCSFCPSRSLRHSRREAVVVVVVVIPKARERESVCGKPRGIQSRRRRERLRGRETNRVSEVCFGRRSHSKKEKNLGFSSFTSSASDILL